MNMTMREAFEAFIENKEYKSLVTILITSASLYGTIYAICAIH